MKALTRSLFTGALLAMAWPTYGLPFLIFFAFVPLLVMEYRMRCGYYVDESVVGLTTRKLEDKLQDADAEESIITHDGHKNTGLKVFGLSYLAFLIWNAAATHWLINSTVFGGLFAIFVNSLLMAVVFQLYHQVAKRQNLRVAIVFFVSVWMAFEKMHLHWEFSWPWLNLGHVFAEFPDFIQWYEITGAFGGSLWILIINVAVFLGWIQFKKTTLASTRKLAFVFFGILAPILLSALLRSTWSREGNSVGEISVQILQPNIDPYTAKYNRNNADVLRDLQILTNGKNSDLIIAPETVLADNTRLKQFDQPSNRVATMLRNWRRQQGADILIGSSFVDFIRDESLITAQSNVYDEGVWYNTFNSALWVTDSDSIQRYDKSKLVVGIENFPYVSVLKPILGDIMIDLGGTVAMKTTQENRDVFTSTQQAYSIAPIICYESVYGDYVTEYVQNGAQALGIITNDGWWGDSQGHKQHLSLAQLRAIETRRQVVRSANTGISAIISSTGYVTDQLEYGTKGNLQGTIKLYDAQTVYVRYGDYLARIAIYLAIAIFLFAFFKPVRKRK